jgi:hypothetical protein
MRLLHLPVKGACAVRVGRRLDELAVGNRYLSRAGCNVLLARRFIVRKIVAGKPVMILFRLALRPNLRGFRPAGAAADRLWNKIKPAFRRGAIPNADVDCLFRVVSSVQSDGQFVGRLPPVERRVAVGKRYRFDLHT